MSDRLSLRDCPTTAAGLDAEADARAAVQSAERDLAAAEAEDALWAALLADPVEVARQRKDPAEVQRGRRKASEAVFSAKVKLATRTAELATAQSAARECAKSGLEILGAKARERIAEIQARFDAHRDGMRQAAADEVALINEVNSALRPVYGYDVHAGHVGVALRPAVG